MTLEKQWLCSLGHFKEAAGEAMYRNACPPLVSEWIPPIFTGVLLSYPLAYFPDV